ncbi:hypothetical protein MKW98_000862 [Papaver atlanticum]|uniref:Uncharacterized protein n=1 Tax=Papaver atlanticum TaxID=357466 RepID=A0AAD4SD95_9MAGN|nr:hypothetical protein MKW98_000862 [Papaver atlanticum]
MACCVLVFSQVQERILFLRDKQKRSSLLEKNEKNRFWYLKQAAKVGDFPSFSPLLKKGYPIRVVRLFENIYLLSEKKEVWRIMYQELEKNESSFTF